jgi:hypothetical protein
VVIIRTATEVYGTSVIAKKAPFDFAMKLYRDGGKTPLLVFIDAKSRIESIPDYEEITKSQISKARLRKNQTVSLNLKQYNNTRTLLINEGLK